MIYFYKPNISKLYGQPSQRVKFEYENIDLLSDWTVRVYIYILIVTPNWKS